MSNTPGTEGKDERMAFTRLVAAKEARKIKARRRPTGNVWAGFSMFGLIGWSVVVPMLLGVVIGLWLDGHYPGSRSWTLTLLIAGLVAGCLNAWRWVAKEQQEIRKEQDDHDE